MAGNPARAGDGEPAKLDELMMAMDVVDTLRHQEGLALKELGADQRDAALRERLRQIYEGQGLTVSDRILDEGIQALKESRFTYTPPPPGFALTMAKLWVRRGQVARIAAVVALLVVGFVGWLVWSGAEAERAAEMARVELTETLPASLATAGSLALEEAKVTAAEERAEALLADGRAALARGDAEAARAAVAALDALRSELVREYTLRIVSRPGEDTGVWRVPDANTGARNYYIVVEAVAPDGATLPMTITSEEDGRTATVTKWGVRVPERTFEAIRRDKAADGIVSDPVLGEKPRGALDPVYAMPVSGGAIIDW